MPCTTLSIVRGLSTFTKESDPGEWQMDFGYFTGRPQLPHISLRPGVHGLSASHQAQPGRAAAIRGWPWESWVYNADCLAWSVINCIWKPCLGKPQEACSKQAQSPVYHCVTHLNPHSTWLLLKETLHIAIYSLNLRTLLFQFIIS